jgi:hypothetical protein
MTPSPRPSYARHWPYETVRPASGWVPKVLSRNHKIPKSHPPSALSRRWNDAVANSKALIARALTRGGTLTINLANANDDQIAVPGRADKLSISSGIEAIEEPCPSFVRFEAS